MESAVQASRSYTIAFGDVGPHGSAVTTYTEAAFLISITQASWTVVTTHGTPPFIKFDSPAGVTTTGELTVTAPGEPPFRLSSVDLYSSTTTIPYVITGILSGHTKFTVAGTLGNTFGNFARVDNPHGNVPVDTLVIRLTNAAFSCCTNPMGLDTIVVRR